MQATICPFAVALLVCVGGLVRAAEEGAVSGRVVDYLARPVEGAEVAVYEKVHDFETDRDLVRVRGEIVRTDAQGRFVLKTTAAPSYQVFIVARKQGLALGWDILIQPSDVVLLLEKPCVLGGVVVDAEGQAVAGAKVHAVPKTSYLFRLLQCPILGPKPWLTALTDSQGHFLFDCFSADVSSDFWIEVPDRGVVYTCSPHWLTACGFETGQEDVRLILPNEVAVRGRVVDAESGRAVADARVVIQDDMVRHAHANPHLPESAITDEDGRFTFKGVPPGWHYIDVSAPFETGLVGERVRFEVRPGRETEEVAASLHKGGTIELEAREERTNEPIPNLPVCFKEAAQDERSSFYKWVVTDCDGIARFQAPASLYKFSTTLDGYSPWQYEGQVVVSAGETEKVSVVLRRYRKVSGVVVDEAGHPVGGATVNHGMTDEAGRFEVPFPSEDDSLFHCLIARCAQTNLAAVAEVERDDEPVRIMLRPALAVSGRIVDPDGLGIPMARVALDVRASKGVTPYGSEVMTDSEGRFSVPAVVPAGDGIDYRICVNASGYGVNWYRRIAIEGEPGGHLDLDPIILQPADQSVTGVVVDANGNPAAAVPIAVNGDNQPDRHTVTDNEGRFVLRRICSGLVRIQAGVSSVREEYGVLRAEGGDRDVRVVMGQDTVHVRYTSLIGKPLLVEALGSDVPQGDLAGRPILVCFFDWQQRPSRNTVVELAGRAEELTGRNVAVLAVQIGRADPAGLDRWIADNRIAFPVRTMEADEQKLRLAWGVRSLPWLIFTDRDHVVAAEGPQMAVLNLDAKER